jgi:hypothetical protein
MISRESSVSISEFLREEPGGSEDCSKTEVMEGDGGWLRNSGGLCCLLVIKGCSMVTGVVVLAPTDKGGVDIASRKVGGG